MPRRNEFPRTCECGGRLKYEHAFGQAFVYCTKCTPVSTIKVPVGSWASPATGGSISPTSSRSNK